MLTGRHALTSFAILALAACGPAGSGGGGDDDNTGGQKDSSMQQPVDDGGLSGYRDSAIYTALDGSGADASCGAQTEPIATVRVVNPPDMLIVLDRSGSMADPPFQIPGFPLPMKWSDMKAALKQLTMDQQMNIKFGLTAYPSDDNCAVPATSLVPIALNSAPQVASWLTSNSPQGNTPTPQALTAAKNIYMMSAVNPNGRYVILATDGEPNCGGAAMDQASETESLAAVTALAQMGIKTFVIGVGDGFGATGITFLNDAATAGQTARPGTTKYYPAANQADLQTAFNAITGAVTRPSCTYTLAKAPPVPNDVSVNLGGTPVAHSTLHTDGWDYSPDAMHITFFGTACTQIMAGGATSVSFVYGCPGPKIN